MLVSFACGYRGKRSWQSKSRKTKRQSRYGTCFGPLVHVGTAAAQAEEKRKAAEAAERAAAALRLAQRKNRLALSELAVSKLESQIRSEIRGGKQRPQTMSVGRGKLAAPEFQWIVVTGKL